MSLVCFLGSVGLLKQVGSVEKLKVRGALVSGLEKTHARNGEQKPNQELF